jgi:hypothetical protein
MSIVRAIVGLELVANQAPRQPITKGEGHVADHEPSQNLRSLDLSGLRWVLPGTCTTVGLWLARHWHDSGAAGSWVDASLMVGLAAGSGIAGAFLADGTGDSATAGAAFAVAGACVEIAVSAFTNNTDLSLIMWFIATVVGYAAMARTNRNTREAREGRAAAVTQTEMTTSTQRYVADSQERTAKHVVDRQSETIKYVADSRERTARYVADSQERSIKYATDHGAGRAAASLAEAQWMRNRGLDEFAEPSVYSVAAASEDAPQVTVPDFIPESFDAHPRTSETGQSAA